MADTEREKGGERRFLLMKRDLYYRPDSQGYTGIKDYAGRYFETDAYPGVQAIHEDDAPEFSPACFHDLREDHIRKQRDEARAQCEAMRKAIVAFLPRNIDFGNETWADGTIVPLDTTLGELRALHSAGEGGRA